MLCCGLPLSDFIHFLQGYFTGAGQSQWQRSGIEYHGSNDPFCWRHNDRDGVSNHQPHDCLLNWLFKRRSKKTSKLRVTGLCAGKFTGDRWLPRTNGQQRGKCFHLMTSSYHDSARNENVIITKQNKALRSCVHILQHILNQSIACVCFSYVYEKNGEKSRIRIFYALISVGYDIVYSSRVS